MLRTVAAARGPLGVGPGTSGYAVSPARHHAGAQLMHSRRALGRAAAGGLAALLAGCAALAPNPAELPSTYLHQAQQLVAARDGAGALAALDRAVMLLQQNNPAPAEPMVVGPSEVMMNIMHARQAIGMGRWQDAHYYITTALTHPSTVSPP